MAQFSYRTSFLAAAVTYGIVVYKTQRAKAKQGGKMPPSAMSLVSDENVQYLRMFSSAPSADYNDHAIAD